MTFERTRTILGASFASLLFFACDPKKEQAAADPAATAAPASASAPASSAGAAVTPPSPPPLLGLVEQLASELKGEAQLYTIEGAVLVASGHRVGRLSNGSIEWLGSVGEGGTIYGPNIITGLSGRYPDAIDATFQTSQGRAPSPTYVPVTGKANTLVFSPGGGRGWIAGVARVGDSAVVAGYDNGFTSGVQGSDRIVHVRGPAISRKLTGAKAYGCKDDELSGAGFHVAIEPTVFGSTRAGTVLSLGSLCEKRGAAAEVWDKQDGTAKIVKLDEHLKGSLVLADILQGPGDLAWIADDEGPIVEYKDGSFTALPDLPKKRKNALVTLEGVLHASDGETIYRWENAAWAPVAHLAWPTELRSAAFVDGAFWGTFGGKLYKLEPAKSVAYAEGCKTPFVHLYDVSGIAEPAYTFPTTRKALSTFDKLDQIALVEYMEGRRRLGVTVPSKEVGDAVVAHVKATMKDEDPKLLCYEPKSPRAIPVAKGR
jgi:hypothetical protein